MSQTFRAFIALDLTDEVRQAIEGLITSWRSLDRSVRFVDPQKMHLTLKFLGDITEEERDQILEVLDGVSLKNSAFEMRVGGIGAFPNWAKPRVLWIGVPEGHDKVECIASGIEDGLSKRGYAREERKFSSHITLARLKAPRFTKELAEALKTEQGYEAGTVQVKTITFYRSHLSSSGPEYEALAHIPLRGTA